MGATLSIISEETWNQHWSTPRPCLQGTRDTLRTYTGQCVKITGQVQTCVAVDGRPGQLGQAYSGGIG